MEIARTLAQVSRNVNGRITHLLLPNSLDLQCRNLMCERVGECCVCRLSLTLDRTPFLKVLDLSNNQLDRLPDNLWTLKHLEELNLSENNLTQLPIDKIDQLTRLKLLTLTGNPHFNTQQHDLKCKIVF